MQHTQGMPPVLRSHGRDDQNGGSRDPQKNRHKKCSRSARYSSLLNHSKQLSSPTAKDSTFNAAQPSFQINTTDVYKNVETFNMKVFASAILIAALAITNVAAAPLAIDNAVQVRRQSTSPRTALTVVCSTTTLQSAAPMTATTLKKIRSLDLEAHSTTAAKVVAGSDVMLILRTSPRANSMRTPRATEVPGFAQVARNGISMWDRKTTSTRLRCGRWREPFVRRIVEEAILGVLFAWFGLDMPSIRSSHFHSHRAWLRTLFKVSSLVTIDELKPANFRSDRDACLRTSVFKYVWKMPCSNARREMTVGISRTIETTD